MNDLDDFTIERQGEATIISFSPAVEHMDSSLVEHIASLMLEPLRQQAIPLLVMDLKRVDFFGSAFLSLLLRCWKLATVRGGMMVLAEVSERARDLLHVTRLDQVWPIYQTRLEALEALLSD